MLNQSKTARDPFTFSLGGMSTIASFAFAPAIAGDRIIMNRYSRLDQAHQGQECHSWQSDHGQTAQSNCCA